ncbi:HDOD domain-containing protein [Candidatus Latescibacterota bacterium]
MTENIWKPMRTEDVDAGILKQITSMIDLFPDLPAHVHEILRIVSDYESDSKEVERLASSDPVIATKILNAVNSAYYGLAKKTDNIRLAIVLLGYAEIRNIALKCGISRVIGNGGDYKGYSTRTLWKHSYLVSVCAETFESDKDSDRAGILLTLGLLHDIGKFALCNAAIIMRKKNIRIQGTKSVTDCNYVLEREQALFGTNHAIIGAMIAKKWGLSKKICAMLEYHHYPSFFGIDSLPKEFAKDLSVISISDQIVNTLESGKNLIPEPPSEFFEILGLKPPLSNLLTDELKDKLEKAKNFLTYIS